VETHMIVRLVGGLLITVVALAVAGRRVWFLTRMIAAGQPSPGRLDDWPKRLLAQVVEVFGQVRLLKWNVPGIAHFFVFWGFLVLFLTIIEAYGHLFTESFAIPFIGRSPVLGFLEDFFALAVAVALVAFAVIRKRNEPKTRHRDSRFYGSHTRAAWVVLGMIGLVVLTLFGIRAAQLAHGTSPWQDNEWAPFVSKAISLAIEPLGDTFAARLEDVMILAHIAVIMGFLVLVTYSKHLHIFTAPINVLTKRDPDGVALGPLLPMMSNGKVLELEEADPETDTFGVAKVEDFTWTAMLDMATCTECGRCQSQCPAWNTGKPLSPKLVIMNLRDHLFAKAPYILGSRTAPEDHVPEFHDAGTHTGHAVPEDGYARIEGTNDDQAVRPLVGTAEEGGVIDPDVLWSCTTCGACVEQCPVDIEHVDHILDMRRYQVLIESAFPSEAGVMLRNLENAGNPWGLNNKARTDWMEGLPFDVRVVDGEIPDEVEYLFWVGCAGALEDRSKKVTRAVAELLHTAGVEFAVLGSAETCNGDPARRLGNEFVFQMLAAENVETLNSVGATPENHVKIVATCPHCFNTLANEYPQLGGNYDVVHHTQLLASLVADGHLVPVSPVDEKVTYHDPCYLGRHNKVYTPPREILDAINGLSSQEMPRCKERGFCCGAGGARMWMEEKIGKAINVERTDEALGLDPDIVSTACPFCMVMLSDAVTAKQQAGEAKDGVQVLDVSQILARSLVAKEPALAGGPAEAETPVEPVPIVPIAPAGIAGAGGLVPEAVVSPLPVAPVTPTPTGPAEQRGENVVTPDVGVEAPKPVGATPAETAQIDQAMLAQVDPSSAPPVTKDPASSGATLETPSVTEQPAGPPPADQAPARTPEGHGPTPGQGPAHSTGTPGDAPGGATEGQGPGDPHPPQPKPE
jgi:Fe-S oxidoreductase